MVSAGERRDQRATWEGFSNALATAVEMVGTTLLFVLFGLWLDGRVGTRPLFTVIFGLLAIIGLALIAYYKHMAEVAREEEGKPWIRKSQ